MLVLQSGPQLLRSAAVCGLTNLYFRAAISQSSNLQRARSNIIRNHILVRWRHALATSFLSKKRENDEIFRLKKPDSEHPAGPKGSPSGEDAFFSLDLDKRAVIAVFDGVGGWAEQGVDPSRASWLLCNATAQQLKNAPEKSMLDALRAALKQSEDIAVKQKILGSTTICMAEINLETNTLQFLNIGDSAGALIRDGDVILETKNQCSSLNAPFQIGIPFEHLRKQGASNSPDDAVITRTLVRPGDTVIVATDGLWDNMSAEECAELAQELILEPTQKLAEELVSEAHSASVNDYDGPFAIEAQKHGLNFTGGKEDDITVTVLKMM